MQAPEADLEGDDHLGVVHPLDVPQVQLAKHFQRLTVRLQVFLEENIRFHTLFPKSKSRSGHLRGTHRQGRTVPPICSRGEQVGQR